MASRTIIFYSRHYGLVVSSVGQVISMSRCSITCIAQDRTLLYKILINYNLREEAISILHRVMLEKEAWWYFEKTKDADAKWWYLKYITMPFECYCCTEKLLPFLLLALSIMMLLPENIETWEICQKWLIAGEWGFSWREPQFMMWVGGLWQMSLSASSCLLHFWLGRLGSFPNITWNLNTIKTYFNFHIQHILRWTSAQVACLPLWMVRGGPEVRGLICLCTNYPY